jgi:hypothetical protein
VGSERNVVLATNLTGNFAKTYYSIDELETDTIKELTANLLYQPRTNNFRFAAYDSLQQVPRDRTATQDVNNNANVNIYSLTPSYFVKLSSTSRIETEYNFSKIEDEVLDSSRQLESVAGSYSSQLNSSLNWSLNLKHTNTEFLDSDVEFEQEDIFLGLEQGVGITRFSFDVGAQKILDMDTETLLSVSLSMDRRINTNSSLRLGYKQGYGDLINDDVSNALLQVAANDEARYLNGIVEENQISLRYDYGVRYFSLRFQLYGAKLKSEETDLPLQEVDEQRVGGNLLADYRFYSRKNDALSYGMTLQYQVENSEFFLQVLENEINTASVKLNYYATKNLTTYLEVSSRNAQGNGPDSNIDEHRVAVGFEWSPRGRLGL